MPKKSPSTKKAADGEEKKVLVGVRVPQSFHDRIQAQCALRGLSLQELVVDALNIFFKVPVGSGRTIIQFIPEGTKGVELPDKATNQSNAWTEIWFTYLKSMPPEKVELLAKAMQWDLQAQRSSRRKPVRFPALQITMGE